MPIDKKPAMASWNIEIKVETIANGYVATARANPSKDDPFGEKVSGRKKAGPWYIREITDVPEMVQHIIEEIVKTENEAMFEGKE